MPFAAEIAIALILLFAPLWALRHKGARLGNFDQRSWPVGRNAALVFADTARASVGAWLLARGLAEAPAWPLRIVWMDDIWLAIGVAVAACVQAFSWRNEDYLMAPVAFWLGGVVALVQPLVLVIALPLGVGGALAFRAWTGFFVGIGVGVAGVGLVVESQDWRRALLLGAASVVFVLIAPLAGRHLGGLRK